MTDQTTKRTYRYEAIGLGDLHSLDLIDELANLNNLSASAYRITIYRDAAGTEQEPETAEAVLIPAAGRIGIAWGAPASWADLHSDLDEAIGCWLNDGDEWEARN